MADTHLKKRGCLADNKVLDLHQKPTSLMVKGSISSFGIDRLHLEIWKDTVNSESHVQDLEQHMLIYSYDVFFRKLMLSNTLHYY